MWGLKIIRQAEKLLTARLQVHQQKTKGLVDDAIFTALTTAGHCSEVLECTTLCQLHTNATEAPMQTVAKKA